MTAIALDSRGLPPGHPLNPEWEVTPRETKQALDAVGRGEGETLLLDCRTPGEYAAARIEGSVLIPMDQIGARLAELREHEDRPIIVHCHHGRRSLQVAAALRKAGFDDVKSMAGGIELWSIDVDPSVPRY